MRTATAAGSSAAAIAAPLAKSLEAPGSGVSGVKPDVVNFVTNPMAHDSRHRGRIATLAHLGHGLPAQAGFALRHECGSHK